MTAPPLILAGLVAVVVAQTPSSEDPSGWLDFLTRGGLLGGALLILWALFTDRLVSGTRHRRELAIRDEELELWRTAASRSIHSLERVAGVFFPEGAPPPTPPPGGE